MHSQEPTRAEANEQKNYILDLLWRVRESARIWRELLRDPAARTALGHIEDAADVLIDRAELLTLPPQPHGPPKSDLANFLP